MTENQTTVSDTAADHDVADVADRNDADVAGEATAGAHRAPEPPAEAEELNRSVVHSVQVLEDPDAEAADSSAETDPAESGSAESGSAESNPTESDSTGDDVTAEDPATEKLAGVTSIEGRLNGSSRRMPAHEQLVAEGDAAGDYLERLLDILDYDGDIDLDVEGERAVVSIIGEGTDVDKLVGERGEVLDALQELTRLAATAETGQRSRLMLDVAGYRAQRRVELSELGTRTANEVLDAGEAIRLAPMNPFERKVVHDAVAAIDGVSSSSEGEEPRRRVVVSPSS